MQRTFSCKHFFIVGKYVLSILLEVFALHWFQHLHNNCTVKYAYSYVFDFFDFFIRIWWWKTSDQLLSLHTKIVVEDDVLRSINEVRQKGKTVSGVCKCQTY